VTGASTPGLEEALPETERDFRLDLIVAGEEVITCRRARRPQAILWSTWMRPRSPLSPPWPPENHVASTSTRHAGD
jgi:hypothetical protein